MIKKEESGASRYKKSVENANSGNSSLKYPEDMMNGTKKNDNFFDIDCGKLSPFTDKKDFDFSEWDTNKFESLKQSIHEVGVLHPILVRPTNNPDKPYEILAGEHRWKASLALGLRTIPGKIIHPCDDKKAKSIFTLTNVLSRDLTILDKIHGWGHYYTITKGHTQEEIIQLKEEKILDADVNPSDYSKRQIRRFYDASTLEPEFLTLISSGILGITLASDLSKMEKKDRELILHHKDKIKKMKDFKKIFDLYQNKIVDFSFNDEGLRFVLSETELIKSEESAKTFTAAAVVSKKVLKKVLKPSDYHRADMVTESAFELFYQLEEHPVLLTKLSAFVQNEHVKNCDNIHELNRDTISKIIDSSIILTALEEYFEKN